MKEEGVEPDLVTYSTLIFGLWKSGRVKEARKYLDILVESWHFPDAVTYTSLMNGMCREGNALGAVVLLEEMERKSSGMTLETASSATLVRALCREGRIAEAYDVFDYAVESKSLTDVAAYSTLEVTL
ncbi:Pentatricopeptide repeat-containing protein [Hibiscus syriacus]|uniref:Pentatricopeptide repeat-containing protein n=1 Tax=Hibiscus syriacus TaxID=106335 RepID=A0A6A2ZN46_HIBSY|nr:Pentatricopeptide repeat-containing protein [Hibiscus syriacus]